jgi:hypothetical protein
MHKQSRTAAAALPELRSAHAARPPNATIRRIAGAVYVRMPDMPRIAHRGVMSAAVSIMLIAAMIVMGVALHGRGRWY